MDDFDALYAAHFASLTTQLFAYLGDREEAQDVVQEAFSRAWSRWRRLSTYEDPVGWVRRVAWNLATSRFRRARVARRGHRYQRPDHVAPPSPDRVVLLTALGALPAPQRQVAVLHYLADLSIGTIASMTGTSVGTVKSRLHRARSALAEQLSPDPRETKEVRHG